MGLGSSWQLTFWWDLEPIFWKNILTFWCHISSITVLVQKNSDFDSKFWYSWSKISTKHQFSMPETEVHAGDSLRIIENELRNCAAGEIFVFYNVIFLKMYTGDSLRIIEIPYLRVRRRRNVCIFWCHISKDAYKI